MLRYEIIINFSFLLLYMADRLVSNVVKNVYEIVNKYNSEYNKLLNERLHGGSV